MTYARTFVHNVSQVPITAWHIEALNKYAWKEKKKSRKSEGERRKKREGKGKMNKINLKILLFMFG